MSPRLSQLMIGVYDRDKFTMSSSTLGLLTDRQTHSAIHTDTDRETYRHTEMQTFSLERYLAKYGC